MVFDETNEGAAYLSALKKSGSPQAAGTAATRAPEAVHSPETRSEQVAPSSRASASSVDKRKSPRYRCKGSARLQESGSAVATWATFTDISMHGCYVEAANPLRVGTMLGLRLEVNGFRVEAAGEVRVAYPNLGMGIRFIKISGRRSRAIARNGGLDLAVFSDPGLASCNARRPKLLIAESRERRSGPRVAPPSRRLSWGRPAPTPETGKTPGAYLPKVGRAVP
jgi:hypothetical protein